MGADCKAAALDIGNRGVWIRLKSKIQFLDSIRDRHGGSRVPSSEQEVLYSTHYYGLM